MGINPYLLQLALGNFEDERQEYDAERKKIKEEELKKREERKRIEDERKKKASVYENVKCYSHMTVLTKFTLD